MANMSSLLDNIRERGSEIHREAVAVMADELEERFGVLEFCPEVGGFDFSFEAR